MQTLQIMTKTNKEREYIYTIEHNNKCFIIIIIVFDLAALQSVHQLLNIEYIIAAYELS